jgi:nucleotide-binding universal stress UspA family protein
MILISFDGSADARQAVEHAAELFKDQEATVLSVWEPFIEVFLRRSSGLAVAPSSVDVEEIDKTSREAAEQIAAEGAELARTLGLTAEPRVRAQATTTARAILAEAETLDASAIVMGSRGLTGVRSVLGSVSHEVIQHADRTVAVVPSRDVAASRARELREEQR